MKSPLLAVALWAAALSAFAQTPAQTAARAYLQANRAGLGLTAADLADVVARDEYVSAPSGLRHLYLQQRHAGVEVDGAVLAVTLSPANAVLSVGNRFVGGLAGRVNAATPTVPAVQAVATAAASRGLTPTVPFAPLSAAFVSDGGVAKGSIPVRLVYARRPDGALRLAWEVGIYTRDEQHYWSVHVDAASSAVLDVTDRVINDAFGGGPAVETDAHLSAWTAGPTPRPLGALGTRAVFGPFVAALGAPRSGAARSGPPYADRAAAPLAGPIAGPLASAFAAAGSYRVFDRPVESPLHGARTLVTTAGDPTASRLGWHHDGTAAYTITKGNNVWATTDSLGAEVGLSPDGGAGLAFDFPLDLTRQPGAYSNAALTNLFYWNNLVHDVFYRYGFTEAAGNFQQTNFGLGGAEGDGVLAQAQDGGGTNNANFLTLTDGVPGRMQMYLWQPSLPATLRLNTPAGIAGDYLALEAGFGPALSDPGLTRDVVYAVPANGCGFTPPTTLPAGFLPKPFDNAVAVNGRIALVDRGGCAFVEKVANAQLSGAAGVIVVNNVPGAAPITMGSSSPAPAGPDPIGSTILIPSVMVTFETGAAIKANLPVPGGNATMLRVGGPVPLRDGDLDNAIVTHEYGHGISTRLTGGPSKTGSCLANEEQGGEGWSDWFALMMTMDASDAESRARGVGTYVVFEGTDGLGIRPARYSTDLGVNPYTYGDVTNPEVSVPHGVGFIWATMLWEVTWRFVERYGFDPDLQHGTGGNNRAIQLVMDALKLQPCSPGFVDARNAILAADKLTNGGADQDLLWAAFAKRGLGYSAVQGSSDDLTDNTEAFDLPPTQAGALTLSRAGTPDPVTNGTVLTHTLTVTNGTGAALTGVVLRDTLDARTVYLAGSASDGGTAADTVVTFPAFPLAAGATATRSYRVFVATAGGSTVLFQDSMEGGGGNWTASGVGANWALGTADAHSPTHAWFAVDPDGPSQQELRLNTPVALGPGTVLSFWHRYATEATFDGGVVELSTDGGTTWTDLGPFMTQNGYDGPIPAANNPLLPDRPAFHGGSGGFVQTLVDLSSFSGQSALVRFVFASDAATGATGWYVDDVALVRTPVSVAAHGRAVAAEGDAARAEAETFVLAAPAAFTAVAPHAFLGGAFDATAGRMRADLNAGGVLPLAQPYADPAYNGTALDHDGAEGVGAGFFAAHPDVVDWVLVELRDGMAASSKVATRAGFVLRDGAVVGLDGEGPVVFDGVAPGAHAVVVRHRNHLAAMSDGTVAPAGSALRHDFRGGVAFGTNAEAALGGGRFGLVPGDANGSGDVSAADRNGFWRVQNGLAGYRSADFNLTGDVSAADRNAHWRVHNGRASQVPQ